VATDVDRDRVFFQFIRSPSPPSDSSVAEVSDYSGETVVASEIPGSTTPSALKGSPTPPLDDSDIHQDQQSANSRGTQIRL